MTANLEIVMEQTQRSKQTLRFGMFEADVRAGELYKAGRRIKLQEQPFRVLALLLDRPAELVTREELRQKLWSADTFVDFDHSLNKAINKIREVLGDSAENPRFIETLARRGYRFIAPVEKVDQNFPLPEAQVCDNPVTALLPSNQADAEKKTLGRRQKLNRWLGLVALFVLVVGSAGWFYIHRTASESTGLTPDLAPMKVVRFTSFPGIEKDPALSPDGKQLAYAWDGEKHDNFDIFVQLIGAGEPLRLTTDPKPDLSPAWSPDGRYIAFARVSEGNSGIYLVPSLGGRERKLAETYSIWSQGKALDWSPDGKLLAVSARSSPQDSSSLFFVSVETGKKERLTSPPIQPGGDTYPAFSPDGQTVAFTRIGSGVHVYAVPVSGGQPRRLTSDAESYGSAWTPAGRQVIFLSGHIGTNKFWMIPSSGGKAKVLEMSTTGSHQAISRQADRLAYVEQIYDTDIWQIEVQEARSRVAAPTKVISSSQMDVNPQYSPDGKRIVFVSSRSGSLEIWVCDSDGRNLLQLTEASWTGSPRWSPDGQYIAFDRWAKDRARIFVVNAEGGSPLCLIEENADGFVPNWSRDGRWIYFCSNRSGSSQIWKMPVEGGQAVRMTKSGGLEPSESPDGKILYYSKPNTVDPVSGSAHLWKMPVQGGEETLVFDRAIYPRYWAVTDRGIYYVPSDWSRSPAIEFFNFATGQVTLVTPLQKPPVGHFLPGLTISPDGRWILCALLEQDTSDIMLVENFR